MSSHVKCIWSRSRIYCCQIFEPVELLPPSVSNAGCVCHRERGSGGSGGGSSFVDRTEGEDQVSCVGLRFGFPAKIIQLSVQILQ